MGQETAGNDPTGPTAAPNGTGGDIQFHEFEKAIDEHVTVQSWEYNESTNRFIINIQADRPSALYISEVVSLDSPGMSDVNTYSGGLQPGEHTVMFAAEPGPREEAAALLQTSRSQREGGAVLVSTGQVADQLPFSKTSGTTGWLAGGFIALIFVVLAGVHTIRQMNSEPQEVN